MSLTSSGVPDSRTVFEGIGGIAAGNPAARPALRGQQLQQDAPAQSVQHGECVGRLARRGEEVDVVAIDVIGLGAEVHAPFERGTEAPRLGFEHADGPGRRPAASVAEPCFHSSMPRLWSASACAALVGASPCVMSCAPRKARPAASTSPICIATLPTLCNAAAAFMLLGASPGQERGRLVDPVARTSRAARTEGDVLKAHQAAGA